MNLKNLYSEYQELDSKNPLASSFFDRIPHSAKKLKLEIQNAVNEAIAHQDQAKLGFALNVAYRDGIDSSYTNLIAQLLIETLHDEHEDLVTTIYLNNLSDNVFSDSLYKIATEPNLYRKYDGELEPTLRKCVHALKTINSELANTYLKNLKATKNSNVDAALSMYGE